MGQDGLLLKKADYFARSKEQSLPNRCPILPRCGRRKDTIEILNKGVKFNPDFLALKEPAVLVVGDGPYIISGNDHYIFGGMCPEVAMFEPNFFLCGFSGSATTKAQHDKYMVPQDQLLETGHFSECSEYNLEISSPAKHTDQARQQGSYPMTVNNTYHNSGSVQAGAVAYGGQAVNNGATNIQYYNEPTLGRIRAELEELDRAVHAADLSEALKQETLAQIVQAKGDPSPGKLKKLADTVGSLGVIAEAGAALAPYAAALAAAAGFA